jgi:hypothetical protein
MRDASTYRSERRNDWRRFRYWNGDRAPWAAFNQPPNSEKGLYGSPVPLGLLRRPARSKYMPHNGKREMARRLANTSQSQGEVE